MKVPGISEEKKFKTDCPTAKQKQATILVQQSM